MIWETMLKSCTNQNSVVLAPKQVKVVEQDSQPGAGAGGQPCVGLANSQQRSQDYTTGRGWSPSKCMCGRMRLGRCLSLHAK